MEVVGERLESAFEAAEGQNTAQGLAGQQDGSVHCPFCRAGLFSRQSMQTGGSLSSSCICSPPALLTAPGGVGRGLQGGAHLRKHICTCLICILAPSVLLLAFFT